MIDRKRRRRGRKQENTEKGRKGESKRNGSIKNLFSSIHVLTYFLFFSSILYLSSHSTPFIFISLIFPSLPILTSSLLFSPILSLLLPSPLLFSPYFSHLLIFSYIILEFFTLSPRKYVRYPH
jgi:hypothetical protein